MIVAISGGKGGTGKSTYAAILARRYEKEGKRVVLCDCDVEGPNLHLLFKKPLGNLVGYTFKQLAEVDEEKCQACGICARKCRFHAIFVTEKARVIENLCVGCGLCKIVCPFGAIRLVKVRNGKIFVTEISENITLVSGIADLEEEETGAIVRQTVEYALSLPADVYILDTAAGMHCNVIQAIALAEKVYVVTEPTHLGAFELERFLKMLKLLGKPAEVVINKAGIGSEEDILKICEKFRVRIVERIPFSEELARKYAEGRF